MVQRIEGCSEVIKVHQVINSVFVYSWVLAGTSITLKELHFGSLEESLSYKFTTIAVVVY